MGIYDSPQAAYGTALISLCDNRPIPELIDQAIDNALESADRTGELPSLVLLHATPVLKKF